MPPGAPPRSTPVDVDKPVWVVTDDRRARRTLGNWLREAGHRTEIYDSGAAALEAHDPSPVVLLIDLELQDLSANEVLGELRRRDPDLAAIVIAVHWELEGAFEAMRGGAYDYVTKPLDRDCLLFALSRAKERRTLLENLHGLKAALGERDPSIEIVGMSAPMQELREQIQRAQRHELPVCIQGDSGTGKHLAARAIHARSARSAGPFVTVNCVGIPDSLQTAELVGYEKEAFLGGGGSMPGKFEQASGGTLFIDAVAEMGPPAQAALERALSKGSVCRVGGITERTVDVRVLCATHRDLGELVLAGRFRADLASRLLACSVSVPRLTDRSDDIPLLVAHFLKLLQEGSKEPVLRVSPEALDALSQHRWPGNVRELQNVVHRSLLACGRDEITLEDLSPDVRHAVVLGARKQGSARDDECILPLRELEKRAIERALDLTRGNVGQAAKLLGIGRATLYRRIAGGDAAPNTTVSESSLS